MKIKIFILIYFISLKVDLKSQGCAKDPYVDVVNYKLPRDVHSPNFCAIKDEYDGPMTIHSASSIAGDWMLVIHDNFDGPTLDETLWIPRVPWTNEDPSDGTIGLKIPENLSFSGGLLKLRGNYKPDTTTYEHWTSAGLVGRIHRDYTSAGISSRIDFPLNSRYQIKCKAFPESKDNWSAFWLFGNHFQEIDIFEIVDNFDETRDDRTSDYFQKMTYHGNKYGRAPLPAASQAEAGEGVERLHRANNLTWNFNQYDLIWDKYRIQWWFNGAVIHEITKFHYCPKSWTAIQVKNRFRKYPMNTYAAMSPYVGKKFAVNKYYPDGQSMKMIIDFDIRSTTTTVYTASKTMDIDYVKVWLRANCSGATVVDKMNYVHLEYYLGVIVHGTTYELGGWVSTDPTKIITVLNENQCRYVATNEIALLNGFSAEKGSVFSAYISTCDAAWSSKTRNENDEINDSTEVENDINLIESDDSDNILLSYLNDGINITSSQNEIICYDLLDICGKLIEHKNINSNSFIIKNENYSKGIYMLKISKQEGFAYKKIFL